jgi:hypothetical protein
MRKSRIAYSRDPRNNRLLFPAYETREDIVFCLAQMAMFRKYFYHAKKL